MAVYTHVLESDLCAFLAQYAVGDMMSAQGILQGVDNSNYHVKTAQGDYVLTIFESRIQPQDIPYYLDFMKHLSDHGVLCPAPVMLKSGEVLSNIAYKPAALFPFLDGHNVSQSEITTGMCGELGIFLARMHLAGQGHTKHLKNGMGFDAWETRLRRVGGDAHPYLDILKAVKNQWPANLPTGSIHADLFPDNVFVLDGHIHGVIDFYFSATDFLVYDLAIVLNAWCFDKDHSLDLDKCRAFLDGYHSIRPLSDAEKSSFQILAQGAALRFLSSRLHDLTFHDPSALVTPKDPTEYIKKLEFHRDNAIF
ncbi:MAG: homoserine kinase [Pseudobdellovibrionaceae bacterium]|nr:homoserine kinase [Pseudobdellovibrionaceae bacterium]